MTRTNRWSDVAGLLIRNSSFLMTLAVAPSLAAHAVITHVAGPYMGHVLEQRQQRRRRCGFFSFST